jgi:hypothetical protein
MAVRIAPRPDIGSEYLTDQRSFAVVPPLPPDELAARYAADAAIVRRGGRTYPAAIEARGTLRVERGDAVVVDAALRDMGAPYLAARRAEHPWLFDGEVMGFLGLDDGVLRLGPGRYFDRLGIGEAIHADAAVRDTADRCAGGRPLHRGDGRGAAPGVTLVATFPDAAGRRCLVLGRRSGLPVADELWHVVPAGTMDRVEDGVDPVAHTAATELREELGLEPAVLDLTLLGLGWDLDRLFPEVVLRADLDDPLENVLATAPEGEHGELVGVEVSRAALAALWGRLAPGELSPPGAAALALLEDSLPR